MSSMANAQICKLDCSRTVKRAAKASLGGRPSTTSQRWGCSQLNMQTKSSFSGNCRLLEACRKQSVPRGALRALITAQGTPPKMIVAITGATGLIGNRLVAKLTAQGHSVRVLTRDANAARLKLPYPRLQFFSQNEWASALAGATGIVNLAGEPIGTRWSPTIKREIKTSRIRVTKKLAELVASLPEESRPKVLVSSSAVGFYGVSSNTTFKEDSAAGGDYLAEVCQEWEGSANSVPVDRVVIIRTGIVLAKNGGALGKMLPIFQIFAGGPLGSGQQWCSWIHRDDLIALYVEALQNPEFKGTYNGTAPNPVRMAELCASLGSALGRPSWLPVPDFALQTLLGEGASVVLDGQRVIPARTQKAGFRFKFENINSAVRNVLGK